MFPSVDCSHVRDVTGPLRASPVTTHADALQKAARAVTSALACGDLATLRREAMNAAGAAHRLRAVAICEPFFSALDGGDVSTGNNSRATLSAVFELATGAS